MIKLQKRAARIILDKDIDASSEDMFAEFHWMKFPDRVDYQKAIIMYKILDDLIPSYRKEYLPSHQMFIIDL